MRFESDLAAIIMCDPARWDALETVRSLGFTDCWIGAGFVRDAVWDHLHGQTKSAFAGDVDVVWFDPARAQPELDRDTEAALRTLSAGVVWSVKNQARMHVRNGDEPYQSVADAMKSWPETATAVAVRLSSAGVLEINAPLGLEDLFGLRLVPTAAFVVRKRPIFERRATEKGWFSRYPLLQKG